MKMCFVYTLCLVISFARPAGATSSGDSSDGSGTSVNGSATTTASNNNSGQSAATLAGAMYGAMSAMEFSSCGPHHPSACALGALYAGMAALSLMQAAENGNVAEQAATTADDTSAATTSTATDSLSTASDSSSTLAALAATKSALKNGINGNTADLTTGKITTSDGSSYSAADFSSPSSMAAAGFSPDQIATAMATADKVNAKIADKIKLGALTSANGSADAGGGGGVKSADTADGEEKPTTAPGLPKNSTSPRQPASVAGLTTNYNGNPIGVSQDDIFKMMSRRYQVKEKQNEFIGGPL